MIIKKSKLEKNWLSKNCLKIILDIMKTCIDSNFLKKKIIKKTRRKSIGLSLSVKLLK